MKCGSLNPRYKSLFHDLIEMIPYGRHSIDNSDIDAVVTALKSDWLTTGPLVDQFETELSKVTGAPCVAVSSGTAALHCAYFAIGLNPGDEIITPPITFIATQATASFFGASIKFADVDRNTANLDPKSVRDAITSKTRAIVAVDYAGQPSKLEQLKEIAEENEIFLIEDAAHSIGSNFKGRPVGSIADITTFSFFPTKNMTSGEGGAVTSSNPNLLARAKKFSRQGLVREESEFRITSEGSWHQEVHEFGLNYRLPDVLCALGISQLSKLNYFKRRRKEIFDYYKMHLANLDWVELPYEEAESDTNWHLYPIRVPASQRKEIFDYLRKSGIGVQVNYLPVYRHPVFESLKINPESFPSSEEFYSREISLPMFTTLDINQLQNVVTTLKNYKIKKY